MDHDGVPGPQRYLDAKGTFAWTNSEPGRLTEVRFVRRPFPIMNRSAGIHIRQFLVEHPVEATFETDHRFRGLQVPVDGNLRPNLQRIQHPLRRIFSSRAEVKILAKTLRVFRFLVEVGE